MNKYFFSILLIFWLLPGCSSLQSSYNMVNCKYSYNSISNLSIDGMNLSNGLNVASVLKLTSLLSGGGMSSLPLDFTVNLNVENPSQSAAALHGMQYVISIDGVQFTTGTVNQALNISAGQTQRLPLTIGVDLISLMQSHSKDAVVNIVKNFIGIGSQKTEVKLQLKPSFLIGNQPVMSPVYIPVTFSFGGKKQ